MLIFLIDKGADINGGYFPRNVVTDINQKSSQILSKPTGTATPVGGAYDIQKTLRELSDNLSHIKVRF